MDNNFNNLSDEEYIKKMCETLQKIDSQINIPVVKSIDQDKIKMLRQHYLELTRVVQQNLKSALDEERYFNATEEKTKLDCYRNFVKELNSIL